MGTTPQSVHHLALQRAEALLKGARVQYAIIDHEGNKRGDLELAPAKSKRKVTGPRNNFAEMFPGYIEQIKQLQVNESLAWPCPPALVPAFRKCVSSVATAAHGQGKCMTAITGKKRDTVEVLRLE